MKSLIPLFLFFSGVVEVSRCLFGPCFIKLFGVSKLFWPLFGSKICCLFGFSFGFFYRPFVSRGYQSGSGLHLSSVHGFRWRYFQELMVRATYVFVICWPFMVRYRFWPLMGSARLGCDRFT
jgi:hypothetical protein